MAVYKRIFDEINGKTVYLYTITNSSGASVSLVTYGGTLMSIMVPDKKGVFGDVLLGYDTGKTLAKGGGYMNSLIGRCANRIGGAKFTLDGAEYKLAKNDGEHTLHGGVVGFDKYIWDAEADGDANGVVLSMLSPDGDEGFPGSLSVTVKYEWSDDNALDITYEATTDKPTVVNLTNHAYFNLAGLLSEDLATHVISIDSDKITEVGGPDSIPTGRFYNVDGTDLDLRGGRDMLEAILSGVENNGQMRAGQGFDHNYVLCPSGFRKVAEVSEDTTGRVLEVYTDQPGVQFYSGNMIKQQNVGKLGVPYKVRQGFCLETQKYPDTPNKEDYAELGKPGYEKFPSVILRPGETYRHHTRYAFSIKR